MSARGSSMDESQDSSKVDWSEDSERLLPEVEDAKEQLHEVRHRKHVLLGSLIANLILSILLLYFVLRQDPSVRLNNYKNHEINNILKQSSYYSPVLDEVELNLSVVQMESVHFGSGNRSIYRGQPSPEVDAAWSRISGDGNDMVVLSRSDMSRIRKDPDSPTRIKVPEDWGFGSDAYPAQLNVFHQIHCLNMLRQGLKENHDYYYGPTLKGSSHRGHCLYFVLQNIMCQASVDLITFDWADNIHWDHPHPLHDVGFFHQCRNFDMLLDWAEAHAVPNALDKLMVLEMPETETIEAQ